MSRAYTYEERQRAMGVLYSRSRIDAGNYCDHRFIAYKSDDVEKACDIAIQAIGQDWIPTCKKLPELHDTGYPYRKGIKRSDPVYITYRQDDKNYFYPLPCRLYDNGKWYTDRDSLKDNVGLDEYDDKTDDPFVVKIVAWRPFPEPYCE